VPLIDISDEVFVVADPAVIAGHIKDPGRLRAWYPGLELEPIEDRGLAGMRWSARGSLKGTAEIWVEPVLDGAVVHSFIRGESSEGHQHWALTIKRAAFSVKDALEAGRIAGSARA
jgi:hypothetical protein